MAAEKVPADNAETLSRLEELRREAQQVSDRSQPTPGLKFVLPSNNHPHPGQTWDRREAGCADPGQWVSAVYLRMPHTDDIARFQVFFDGLNGDTRAKLTAIANEVAKLLPRLGYDVIQEQLYFELFERCEASGRLSWQLNEQPDHPEAKSVVARLDDVFGEIAVWLREIIDQQNPVTSIEGQQGRRRRKSTGPRRTTEELFKAALRKHHGYESDGGVLNVTPMSTRQVEGLVGISDSTALRLFKKYFGSVEAYRTACFSGAIKPKLVVLLGDALHAFGTFDPTKHDAEDDSDPDGE